MAELAKIKKDYIWSKVFETHDEAAKNPFDF